VGGFWGEPTFQPKNKDVVKLVAYLREQAKNQPHKRTLQTATSAMRAIVAYVAEEHSPREALAILDLLRKDVAGLS